MVLTQHTGHKFFSEHDIIEEIHRDIPALLGREDAPPLGLPLESSYRILMDPFSPVLFSQHPEMEFRIIFIIFFLPGLHCIHIPSLSYLIHSSKVSAKIATFRHLRFSWLFHFPLSILYGSLLCLFHYFSNSNKQPLPGSVLCPLIGDCGLRIENSGIGTYEMQNRWRDGESQTGRLEISDCGLDKPNVELRGY